MLWTLYLTLVILSCCLSASNIWRRGWEHVATGREPTLFLSGSRPPDETSDVSSKGVIIMFLRRSWFDDRDSSWADSCRAQSLDQSTPHRSPRVYQVIARPMNRFSFQYPVFTMNYYYYIFTMRLQTRFPSSPSAGSLRFWLLRPGLRFFVHFGLMREIPQQGQKSIDKESGSPRVYLVARKAKWERTSQERSWGTRNQRRRMSHPTISNHKL